MRETSVWVGVSGICRNAQENVVLDNKKVYLFEFVLDTVHNLHAKLDGAGIIAEVE